MLNTMNLSELSDEELEELHQSLEDSSSRFAIEQEQFQREIVEKSSC